MLAYLTSLGVWNWFIVAALLFVVEMIAPGAFMLWLGISAVLVGAVSLVIDWSWQAQCAAFVLFSAALFPLWRRFQNVAQPPSDQPLLNQRSQTYVGRVFTLDKPIVDGTGAVRIDDTVWRVTGADLAAGRQVKVARADGATLYVEPV
jgi:inner membrane protein